MTHYPRLIQRPPLWITAWGIAFIGARIALEAAPGTEAVRIAAALLPVPLAFAFILFLLLLMTLGRVELDIPLNRENWSNRHVWALLPTLSLAGLIAARRRYA